MHNDKYESLYTSPQINSSSRLYRSVAENILNTSFYVDGCQVINFELSIIMTYIRCERTYGRTNERTNERMNEWICHSDVWFSKRVSIQLDANFLRMRIFKFSFAYPSHLLLLKFSFRNLQPKEEISWHLSRMRNRISGKQFWIFRILVVFAYNRIILHRDSRSPSIYPYKNLRMILHI